MIGPVDRLQASCPAEDIIIVGRRDRAPESDYQVQKIAPFRHKLSDLVFQPIGEFPIFRTAEPISDLVRDGNPGTGAAVVQLLAGSIGPGAGIGVDILDMLDARSDQVRPTRRLAVGGLGRNACPTDDERLPVAGAHGLPQFPDQELGHLPLSCTLLLRTARQ